MDSKELTSKESGGPWPSKNATRDGQVAFVWAIAQNLSVHGAKMTNLRPTHSKKRTLSFRAQQTKNLLNCIYSHSPCIKESIITCKKIPVFDNLSAKTK